MDTEWNELCWIIIFGPTEAFTRGTLIPIFYSDYFCPCQPSWGVSQPFPILRYGALCSHLVSDPFPTGQHTALIFVKTNRFFYCPKESFFFLRQQLEKDLSVSKTEQKKTKQQNSEPVQCAQYGNRPRTNNVLIVCALASLLVLSE